MLKTWTVYDGGQQDHPDELTVMRAVRDWRSSAVRFPQHPSKHVIISDAVAQTIAAWWLDGRNSYTMMLATSGTVDRYTTLSDFGDPERAETEDAATALQALGAYIESKIGAATVAVQPCACGGCFDIVVGIVGELCPECEEWGCDATDALAGCERPDANE